MKVELKGPFYNSFPTEPDIMCTVVDGVTCLQNKITIHKAKNTALVYHTYDATDRAYSGRWYDTRFTRFDEVNDEARTVVYTIPVMELVSGKVKRNVPVEIRLSDKGWDVLWGVLGR